MPHLRSIARGQRAAIVVNRRPAGIGIGVRLCGCGARPRVDAGWHDAFVVRLEALALMQTLNAQILSSLTAMLKLERCTAIVRSPIRRSSRRRCSAPSSGPATAEQRQRLKVAEHDAV